MIQAAGGVVWRRRAGGVVEVLAVHRPRYDDWSLPKGKLDRGESSEDAALREVEEETGLVCELGPELPEARYTGGDGQPKVVRYWAMRPLEDTGFTPGDEVDELRWVPVGDVHGVLTYAADHLVVEALGPAL